MRVKIAGLTFTPAAGHRLERAGNQTRIHAISEETVPVILHDSRHDGLFLQLGELATAKASDSQLLSFVDQFGTAGLDPPTLESLATDASLIGKAIAWRQGKSTDRQMTKLAKFQPDAITATPGADDIRAETVFERLVTHKSRGCGVDLSAKSVTLRCDSAIQFAWLQLWEAWVRGFTYERCRFCGKPFRKKQNRKFCSNTCQSRTWVELRSEGVQLLRLGRTPAQVAKELGVSKDLAAKWQNEELGK